MAGFPPWTLPGQEHDGLQQSQKRVVNPAVPVVGGLHAGGGGEPELLLLEPPELLEPLGLPELELLDPLGLPVLLLLLELLELEGLPELPCIDPLELLELLEVLDGPVPFDEPEELLDDVDPATPLDEPPLDPLLTGRPPELEPVFSGGLLLASSLPASSGAEGEAPLQATTAPPAHTATETIQRRRSEVRWEDVYM